jgi:hypothetical protein
MKSFGENKMTWEEFLTNLRAASFHLQESEDTLGIPNLHIYGCLPEEKCIKDWYRRKNAFTVVESLQENDSCHTFGLYFTSDKAYHDKLTLDEVYPLIVAHYLPKKEEKYSLDREFDGENPPLVKCRKSGYAWVTEGESGYKYAIFNRAEVEAKLGPVSEENAEYIMGQLVPWHARYGGPGRSFTSDPSMRLYKRNILIRQQTGLDI